MGLGRLETLLFSLSLSLESATGTGTGTATIGEVAAAVIRLFIGFVGLKSFS